MKSPRFIGAVFAVLLSAITPAMPFDLIEGRARIVDGDTVAIGGERIRLYGIDAPERRQSCRSRDRRRYDCGTRSAGALADLVGRGGSVRCTVLDHDRFGRSVAVCETRSGLDLGRAMVERGMAIEYPAYSDGRYGAVEAVARRERRGLWSGAFVRPWEWRHRSR